MPDTRRSSLSKKNVDVPKGEKTDNPKSLLKYIVQLNETVPPSQPDDSPTVTNIKQKVNRRSSRRSSGIQALSQTPHVLLKNYIENAQEETPILVTSSDEASAQSDAYLAPIPRKISKVVDDNQSESYVFEEETDVVRKMPRTRHKAVLQKFSDNLKQQSESPGEDSGSEIKQQPSRAKKIRNKITAEDIASGIKLSQEKAAETERSYNVTGATKTEISLGYLSVNTLNAENLQDTIAAVAGTSEKTDSLAKREEKEDSSSSSKSEKSSKRKRSIIKQGSSKVEPLMDLSDEEEETLQKSKIVRLRTDTAEFVSFEGARPAEVEKPDVPKFVSEAELTEVAYTVEVAESVEMTENVEEVGSKEKSGSHNIEGKEIVQSLAKNVRQETEESATLDEDSIQSKFNEINKLLQDESVKTMNVKNSKKQTKEAIAYTSDTKRANNPTIAGDESSEQSDLKSSQTVSKTSKEILSTPEINMETVDDSTDAHSKNVKSNLEDVEAVSDSSRGDDSDVSKGSGSKEYLAENIDSSYVEASTQTSEFKKFTAKKHKKPLLVSKVGETLASGDTLTSDVDVVTPEIVKSNVGAISVRDANSSIISHESSPIVSQMSEDPVQSNETKAEEKEQSKETRRLTNEKRKNKELGSLAGERVSTDEQDELFPSSPKETTSSGHSRSSSPPSSEADKATRRLTLPSSKSAFVEMKSARSNVPSPTSGVLTKRISSVKRSNVPSPTSGVLTKRISSVKRSNVPSPTSGVLTKRISSVKRSNVPSPTSGVLTKRISSVKKSSKKEKSSEQQENKSYRVIDSFVSPTESVHHIEASQVTKDAQILPQSPFGTMRSLQHTAERPVAPEPQAGPSQNTERSSRGPRKNKIRDHFKKYTIPPNVTSLLINHYSGLKIPTACLLDLGKISDRFFDNLFEALNSYAKHASRRKIQAPDVELYFKRVGLVNKNKSIKTLIREYLPLEDQQLLIPVARSGNVVTGGLSNQTKK